MAEESWQQRLRNIVRRPDISWENARRWALYPAFFLFCFVLFAYWTFPYERLRDKLVEEAAKQGYELEIIDLSPSRLSGVTLEGVRLVMPAVGDQPPVDLLLDELTVRASILSALTSTKSFSFDAELAGGESAGDVSVGEDSFAVDAEFSDVELKQLPALRRFTKVPLFGKLNGEIAVSMPAEIDEANGAVDVTIENMRIGDGETKVDIPGWGGLTLDEANAGNLEIQATIEDGFAEIDTFKANGEDLKLDVIGHVKLARPMKRSQLNLMLRAKIEEAFKQRSPKIATMLELASTGRDYKAAETSDGSLQYKVQGTPGGRIRPQAVGKEPFRAPSRPSR